MAAGNKLLSGKIEFIEYHKPGLMSGDYEVTVDQEVSAAAGKIPKKTDGNPLTFRESRQFTVAGPRFQLSPQDIYSVFPPPGSTGDHSHVLPHVIFNRSTLPWERATWSGDGQPKDVKGGSSVPWLALLVFHQDDLEEGRVSQAKVKKLGKLQEEAGDVPWDLDEHLMDASTEGKVHVTTAMPAFELGSDQHANDKVTVIDVEKALLGKIQPPPADLDFLGHMRQRKTVSVDVEESEFRKTLEECRPKETKIAAKVFKNGDYAKFREALKKGGIRLSSQCSILCRKNGKTTSEENPEQLVDRLEWVFTNIDNKKQFVARADKNEEGGEVLNVFTNDAEVAIVVASRLPMADGNTTVHLVSLEDRYDSGGSFQYGGEADFARLVSLKQWNFSCTTPNRTFKDIIRSLDKDTLRLKKGSESGKILEKGYVPLRHHLRKGDKTVSWYHSPLLPWRNTERLYGLAATSKAPNDFPQTSSQHGGWTFTGSDHYWVGRSADKSFKVTPCFGSHPRVSDQLLRLDQESGVFDTTYAAAWKLGRLMAMEDRRFSVALTNWKRSCAQHVHRVAQSEKDSHLQNTPIDSLAPPPLEVSTWFDQRNLLKGVPFNYLVPDSRMLPEESIRFFEVDPLWLDCLLDGAFSLGRVTESDHQQDYQHIIADNRYPKMSGLLIRSEAVSGWPGMLVDAYYKLDDTDTLFSPSEDEEKCAHECKDDLRKNLEKIGLPLPREFSVKYSADKGTCTLNDLDTNPDYVDTVLGEDSNPSDPQLCLMMPDRDRQYHYTIINEGTLTEKQLYLKLPLLRQERLGNGVLLCLFQGAIERIDVHLKPETLHFGLKREGDGYSKELKNESGEELKKKDENGNVLMDAKGEEIGIELKSREMTDFWKTGESKPVGGGTLNIKRIADKFVELTPLTKITSARFALQMIEGNELVRFSIE